MAEILKNAGSHKILSIMGGSEGESPLQLIEVAGRTAYQSRDKISDESASRFVEMIRKRGHESVLEHSCMTVEFNNVSRGFCYDDKTEVLTKEGWKYFYETTEKDKFLTLNLKNKKIEYQKRKDFTAEDWNGQLIYGKSSMVDFAVTPNHRMVYFPYDKRVDKEWGIAQAKEIYGKRVKFERGLFNNWTGLKIKNKYSQQDSLSFAKFMGVFITDGSLWKGKQTGGRIVLSQTKKGGRDFIRKTLSDLGWNFKERRDGFRINDTKLYHFLRKYFPETKKKSEDGRVPEWIRMSSPEYIREFMNGVIVGDGNIHKGNKHIVIYSGSQKLSGDYQECIFKMGLCSTVRMDDRRGQAHKVGKAPIKNKRKSYIVSITKRTNAHLFNRKLWSKRKYRGKVYCVTVPNGTLYVRRNGKAFWSGNTHEMVRHRLVAYTQESTRYVDESNFRVVVPPDKDPQKKIVTLGLPNGDKSEVSFEDWVNLNEQMYRGLRKAEWVPQDARQTLPIGIKSQIVATANFREWRHIFTLRCSPKAHWEIRRVMTNLLKEVKERVPVIFDDFEILEEGAQKKP